MAEQGRKVGRGRRALKGARRLWPYLLMAWERWQALPDDEKQRYKRQAREYAERGRGYAERGRKAIKERRPGGGGRSQS